MARAAKPAPAKRKKILVYRQDQGGDILVSGGVAKIRLTPKVILLFILMAGAAVSVVILAARQGGNQVLSGSPIPAVRESATETAPPVTQAPETPGPVISSLELSPQNATVAAPIELRFVMANPETGDMTYAVRWFVNESPVLESPSTSLSPEAFRKGSSVYAEFTAMDASGRSATLASPPVTVVNTPPTLTEVTLDPRSPSRGMDLTAHAAAGDMDNDPLTCQYQWLVNGAPAGTAGPRNTFATANLAKQDSVSVSVICSDGQDATLPAVSASVAFGNSNPEIVSTAPDSVENGVYTYAVDARDPDGDVLRYRLENGPAGITIDQATGLIQWTVPKGVMYPGRNEIQVKVTVEDGDGGTVSQEFVIVLNDYVAY